MTENSSDVTQGNLFIIAAPSGAGKTSLVNALLERCDNCLVSISYTTRKSRPGEVDGVNYFFVDDAHFQHKIDTNQFLEYANVFGNFYGTSRTWVLKQLDLGHDVILEIDWQGAAKVRSLFPSAIGIFIMPPSINTLASRLKNRNTDDETTIALRMQQAKSEMQHYVDFDYLVINDDFETAVTQLLTVIQAKRLRTPQQALRYADLLEELIPN